MASDAVKPSCLNVARGVYHTGLTLRSHCVSPSPCQASQQTLPLPQGKAENCCASGLQHCIQYSRWVTAVVPAHEPFHKFVLELCFLVHQRCKASCCRSDGDEACRRQRSSAVNETDSQDRLKNLFVWAPITWTERAQAAQCSVVPCHKIHHSSQKHP